MTRLEHDQLGSVTNTRPKITNTSKILVSFPHSASCVKSDLNYHRDPTDSEVGLTMSHCVQMLKVSLCTYLSMFRVDDGLISPPLGGRASSPDP